MHTLKAQLGFLTALVVLVVPAAAPAQSVVPPGNSAVNQYTETFPTARGQKTTQHNEATKRDETASRSPRDALGSRNAQKLASEGPVGQELAEVVAETAPPATRPEQRDGQQGGNGLRADVDESSALTEIVRQASDSSDSGGMGLALPLLILAAFVGFGFYAWHRRRIAA